MRIDLTTEAKHAFNGHLRTMGIGYPDSWADVRNGHRLVAWPVDGQWLWCSVDELRRKGLKPSGSCRPCEVSNG